jgi:hypothetical protein
MFSTKILGHLQESSHPITSAKFSLRRPGWSSPVPAWWNKARRRRIESSTPPPASQDGDEHLMVYKVGQILWAWPLVLISHMLHVCYIYLHDWLIFRTIVSNVGEYSIHGA